MDDKQKSVENSFSSSADVGSEIKSNDIAAEFANQQIGTKPPSSNSLSRLFIHIRKALLFVVIPLVILGGLGFAAAAGYHFYSDNKVADCGTTVENQGSYDVKISGNTSKSTSTGAKLNNCFEKRFQVCKPAQVTYTYPKDVPLLGGVVATNTIIGKANGGCQMQSTYSKYPLAVSFQNKSLICTYDNAKNSLDATSQISNDHFKGCSGPLYQMLIAYVSANHAPQATIQALSQPTPTTTATITPPTKTTISSNQKTSNTSSPTPTYPPPAQPTPGGTLGTPMLADNGSTPGQCSVTASDSYTTYTADVIYEVRLYVSSSVSGSWGAGSKQITGDSRSGSITYSPKLPLNPPSKKQLITAYAQLVDNVTDAVYATSPTVSTYVSC